MTGMPIVWSISSSRSNSSHWLHILWKIDYSCYFFLQMLFKTSDKMERKYFSYLHKWHMLRIALKMIWFYCNFRWKIVMELSIKRHAYNITGHSFVHTLTWIWSGFGFFVSLSSVSYEKIYKYNTTIANRMSKLKQSPNRRVNKLVVSLIYCNVLCVFDSIIFCSCFSQLLSLSQWLERERRTLYFL